MAAAPAGAGDPTKGKTVARKCQACHSFEEGGANKIGPGLYGVIGRAVGRHEGFSYSAAMAEKGGVGTRRRSISISRSPRSGCRAPR